MKKRTLGKSGLEISPLVLGGNVFGWTIDESTSFRILDAFVDAGFDMIDTAEVYSRWAPGNQGGESETIIGKWLKQSGKRGKVKIATKVGYEMGPDKKGLSRARIMDGIDGSLRRLGVEVIDLYQNHVDDLQTPLEETLGAFDELVRLGKVRAIGASQMTAERLVASLECSQNNGWHGYSCLQPLYNLYDRQNFEENLLPVIQTHQLGVISYYALAAGFLSGKYRTEGDLKKSVRGTARVQQSYFNEKGHRLVRALDQVAQRHGSNPASVAIAWILHQPGVTAPISSATSIEQLNQLLAATRLVLDTEDFRVLGHHFPLMTSPSSVR